MTLKLNLDGLLNEEPTGDGDVVRAGSTRKTSRISIALNYSDASKPMATALAYWQKSKIATPLFWFIFDKLSAQRDPSTPRKFISASTLIQTVSPVEFGREILFDIQKLNDEL